MSLCAWRCMDHSALVCLSLQRKREETTSWVGKLHIGHTIGLDLRIDQAFDIDILFGTIAIAKLILKPLWILRASGMGTTCFPTRNPSYFSLPLGFENP
jgi:hypothetical protein